MATVEQQDAMILELCRELGTERNHDGTPTAGMTDTEVVNAFRGNHPSDLIEDAASGDVSALIKLRQACGLPAIR